MEAEVSKQNIKKREKLKPFISLLKIIIIIVYKVSQKTWGLLRRTLPKAFDDAPLTPSCR